LNAGSCSSTVANVNAVGFGGIQSTSDPRIGQLNLKINF